MTDSLVQCQTCGREENVSFGHCLFNGWPKCCGYTMRLMTTDADIDKAVSQGISKHATIEVQNIGETQA